MVALLVPPGAAAELTLEPVGDYVAPIYVTSDPEDPDRLFVVERAGRIQLTEGEDTTTFLDIESLVLSPPEPGSTGDHGMFSIAFSPDYATDHLFYVAYSRADDPDTEHEDESGEWQIAEFEANGDSADPASRREVLTIDYPAARLHYAGQLQFGPDGYLYASTGDGGPQGDPDGNAQNHGNLLGKILRIDPQGSVPGEYSVPADNPFAGATPGADEIWSSGLRNPWRFSFDRDTGDLVIGDVGHLGWEEINYRPQIDGGGRGDNFGWACREGFNALAGAPEECDSGAGPFTDPVFAYPHGSGCAIMGGYVVRDPSLTDLYGRYLYGDFCTGELRSILLDVGGASDDRSEGLSVPNFSLWSFGEDADGRIYVASHGGTVCRIVDEGGTPDCDMAPSQEPPAEEPPAEEPPAEEPPAEEPPPQEPPAEEPPPQEPPAEEPPLQDLPLEDPLLDHPPFDLAPPNTTPSETDPPAAQLPANNFRFIRVNRLRRKGGARLVIRVPAAGTLWLLGNRRVRAAGPKAVGQPRVVRLLVRPKGRALRKLNRLSGSTGWGRVRVRARVRFVPTGGEPRVRSRPVWLIKRR